VISFINLMLFEFFDRRKLDPFLQKESELAVVEA
jgi:hypothetical protein